MKRPNVFSRNVRVLGCLGVEQTHQSLGHTMRDTLDIQVTELLEFYLREVGLNRLK